MSVYDGKNGPVLGAGNTHFMGPKYDGYCEFPGSVLYHSTLNLLFSLVFPFIIIFSVYINLFENQYKDLSKVTDYIAKYDGYCKIRWKL